jgi:hypothetical protein
VRFSHLPKRRTPRVRERCAFPSSQPSVCKTFQDSTCLPRSEPRDFVGDRLGARVDHKRLMVSAGTAALAAVAFKKVKPQREDVNNAF